MGFGPLQVMLRGVVDELLFGRRPDPLDAASRVAGQVGDDPVAGAARDPRGAGAAVRRRCARTAGSWRCPGPPTRTPATFPLEGADAELVVGLRPGDLSLSRGDEHVLRLVGAAARPDAAGAGAGRATCRSRARRRSRRWRRSVGGCGATSTTGSARGCPGIAFTSDAARNLVRTDPEAADALLEQLRADTTTAIEDIRRLVYAMRPPALDELGLVPRAAPAGAGLRTRDGRPLRCELDVPAELPTLTAAVEVAAYRIVVGGAGQRGPALRGEDGHRDHARGAGGD